MLVDNELRDAVVASLTNFFVNEHFMLFRLNTPEIEMSVANDRNFFLMLRISFERNWDGVLRAEVNSCAT